LVAAGYHVTLVGQGTIPDLRDGVSALSVRSVSTRVRRLLVSLPSVMLKARGLRADVYHLHDPELLSLAWLLRLKHNSKVIYDAHEDLPLQVLTKPYIPAIGRPLVSWAASRGLAVLLRSVDAVVAATPSIQDALGRPKTVLVQNFPVLGELSEPSGIPYGDREALVVYVGGISETRGAREMVSALAYIPVNSSVRLKLVGVVSPASLTSELQRLGTNDRVELLGWQDRDSVRGILSAARLGLVLLQPARNYIESMPTKLFEYMSAALPVVASDFPLWRSIVESAGCGLLVDPRDPKAIADAINWLIEHPAEAEEMGKRGLEAVRVDYDWNHEAKKLVNLYEELLS
jgi:glycosyltransferase involved in cell wall biosynthesis